MRNNLVLSSHRIASHRIASHRIASHLNYNIFCGKIYFFKLDFSFYRAYFLLVYAIIFNFILEIYTCRFLFTAKIYRNTFLLNIIHSLTNKLIGGINYEKKCINV